MKKINGILLVGGLTLSAVGGLATLFQKGAVKAEAAIGSGKIFVDGKDIVAQTDQKIEDGDGGYVQLVGNVLTFNNYTYSGPGMVLDTYKNRAAININAPEDLEFNFIGTSSITTTDNPDVYDNACLNIVTNNHNLKFTGNGSVTFASQSSTSNRYSRAINLSNNGNQATNTITFDGPSITMNANNNNGGATGFCNGNQSKERANVILESGSLTANVSSTDTSYGFKFKELVINSGSLRSVLTGGKNLWSVDITNKFTMNTGTFYSKATGGTGTYKVGLYLGDAAVDIANTITSLETIGEYRAIYTEGSPEIYTAAEGKCWTNVEGTEGQTNIPDGTLEYRTYRNFKNIKLVYTQARAAYVTEPTAITGISYDGQPHELVNAGSSEQGTVVYRLGDTGEFSTTIPTATNAGTYTVQYMIKGEGDYRDSAIKSVEVNIIDKTALSSAIDGANKIVDIIKDSHEDLLPDLQAAIESAQAVLDDPNALPSEIASATDSLLGVEVNVVKALIDDIGEVTAQSGKDIEDAKKAYELLPEEQKESIEDYHNTLVEKEKVYIQITGSKKPNVLAIVLGIVGGVLLLLCLAYVLMMFVLNKWINKDGKAVRAFKLGKKEDKVRLLVVPCKFEYRNESEVYNSKSEAENK